MKRLLLLIIVVLISGCGSGSDESDEIIVPDLAVIFVSGHTNDTFDIPDGEPSYSYLDRDAGPDIVDDLRSAGYTVEASYYVDDAFPVMGVGGFQNLIAYMKAVRDLYIPYGTRVIVIAHSHGGVWAHAAIQQTHDLTITAEVDLDTSSYGWNLVGHNTQNNFIGGDPIDKFQIKNIVEYPYPVPSERTEKYDIEDVIFQNVRFSLEVRSGASPLAPVRAEMYDEKWNIRLDGSADNLYGFVPPTYRDHMEVHTPGLETLPYVKNWLRLQLTKS